MDRLQSVEVFLKVAELGSYSAAAVRLGMSKSTVSKHVAALEARLGIRLLNRTTRRLSLTEGGQIFRDRGLTVIDAMAAAEQCVTRLTEAPRGKLKVNAPMTFGIRYLSPILPRFLETYPEVELELSLNDRRVDLIDEGYDLAVRIGKLDDSSLIARKLARTTLACVASPAYLERHKPPTHPNELSAHACLRYSYSLTPGEWRFDRDGETVRVRVDGRYVANNGDVIREAAIAGLGVSCQPLFFLRDELAQGRLLCLLEDWSMPELVVHAVYPESRHVSPKLRAFIDFLVVQLKEVQ